MSALSAPGAKGIDQHVVFWHRELPPTDAEAVAEYVLEADSGHATDGLERGVEPWNRCYRELMANAERRLTEEVARLGGEYAHVHDETIVPKHDYAAGEVWLHGRFMYALYRRRPHHKGRRPDNR